MQLIAPWAVLEKQRVISLPDSIVEAISSPHVQAASGLFPEIQRAWIALDNVLHLWNYLEGTGSAIETYEHPDGVIKDVALVTPRAGVFIPSIKHVLVISGPSSLSLLCLAWDQPKIPPGGGPVGSAEMALYVPDMKVETGGVLMSDVCATKAGRIFCRGSDNCIHELIYQASEGWFTKKCYLRNLTSPWLNIVPGQGSSTKGKRSIRS